MDRLNIDLNIMKDESYITFQIFKQFHELVCAFSTRRGGFSKGNFSSLNMGNIKNDDRTVVMNNRRLFFKKLAIAENTVALPDQIHSANIKSVLSPGIFSNTDALVTSITGIFLGIQTADCFPVFIYCPKKKITGIIHAGWKGAVQNIVIKTVELLVKNFGVLASELFVAIGPGLQKECFEVRSDVFEIFPRKFLEYHEDPAKRFLNLSGYLKQQLISLEIPVDQIYVSMDCTKCNQKRYYSYRRDGERSGRMLGIIGLRQ